MDIVFHSKSLRDICESEEMLKKHFGNQVGESVKRRLADLRAAASITDLAVGNPRELATEIQPTMSVDLPDDYRLIFRPNHLKTPLDSDRRVNWSAVTRIKVMSIEQPHD
ncbi:MAG: hypothetical protein ABL907_14705 [Hyphomicrobium sp.]